MVVLKQKSSYLISKCHLQMASQIIVKYLGFENFLKTLDKSMGMTGRKYYFITWYNVFKMYSLLIVHFSPLHGKPNEGSNFFFFHCYMSQAHGTMSDIQ